MNAKNLNNSRYLSLSISGIQEELLLSELYGTEELSQLYEYKLELQTQADLSNSLNAMATASFIDSNGKEKYFTGYIIACTPTSTSSINEHVYKITIAPWLWHLTQNKANRIYIDKTPREIIQDIFSQYQHSYFDLSMLEGGNDPLEYLAQYQESDYNFLARLLEKHGFYYYFKQKEDKHQLLISDNLVGYCKTNVAMSYTHLTPLASTVKDWKHEYSLVNSKVKQSDYNFKVPTDSLLQEAAYDNNNLFDYQYNYPGDFYNNSDGEALTKIRAHQKKIMGNKVRAESLYAELHAGSTFNVIKHDIGAEQGKYLVVKITHECKDKSFNKSGGNDEEKTIKYKNNITCISAEETYQPPQRANIPEIAGFQVGTVIAPEGQDVFADEYGRVKVKFNWLQGNESQAANSYWIRVAQSWAGAGWGTQFIPRAGHEVIINFENGDPSRPLIIGSTYNGNNMPPYPLPANQTKSGIRTQSTNMPDNSAYNEISFEDLMGQEEVYVHAQKDLNKIINNNENIQVGNDYNLSINAGNQSIEVPKGTVTITAGSMVSLQAGTSKVDIDASGITIQGNVININS